MPDLWVSSQKAYGTLCVSWQLCLSLSLCQICRFLPEKYTVLSVSLGNCVLDDVPTCQICGLFPLKSIRCFMCQLATLSLSLSSSGRRSTVCWCTWRPWTCCSWPPWSPSSPCSTPSWAGSRAGTGWHSRSSSTLSREVLAQVVKSGFFFLLGDISKFKKKCSYMYWIRWKELK